MTLRNQPEYAELADHLLARAERGKLIYIRNPGNWGDAVIHAGEEAFFKAFSIPIHRFHLDWTYIRTVFWTRYIAGQRHPTVLFGGGGALAGQYPSQIRRLRLILAGTRGSVVMPSTYGPDTARRLKAPSDCTYWARDRSESQHYMPGAPFCHDLGLFLDLPRSQPAECTGMFFRVDRERVLSRRELPPQNRDISAEATHLGPVNGFIDAVGRFAEIHTDRLHVAIVGALMGRRVHLHANSYYKNRAIFESSLQPFYPNVTFHDRSG